MSKLNPCPYCDSENVELICSGSAWFVKCHDCEATGPGITDGVKDDTNQATIEWNEVSSAVIQLPVVDPDGLRFRTLFAAARKVDSDRDGTAATEINARLNAIMVEDEDGESVADIDALRQVLDGLVRDKLVEVE